MAPLASAGEDNEPDKAVQDEGGRCHDFIWFFVMDFILQCLTANVGEDKEPDKVQDKAGLRLCIIWFFVMDVISPGSPPGAQARTKYLIKSKIKNPIKGPVFPGHCPSSNN